MFLSNYLLKQYKEADEARKQNILKSFPSLNTQNKYFIRTNNKINLQTNIVFNQSLKFSWPMIEQSQILKNII